MKLIKMYRFYRNVPGVRFGRRDAMVMALRSVR